jgi:hypothetical protein
LSITHFGIEAGGTPPTTNFDQQKIKLLATQLNNFDYSLNGNVDETMFYNNLSTDIRQNADGPYSLQTTFES